VWSPDGAWLAYASNVSGRDEIYVQRYPTAGSPILVSTAGGRAPVWNPNGRELVYTEAVSTPQNDPSGKFRVMSVSMADPSRPGRPQRLFEAAYAVLPLDSCASTACYSISADGQSFYTLQLRPRDVPRVTSVRLILNWFDDVRRLAAAN
jgi:Tol biopolymer transport system component